MYKLIWSDPCSDAFFEALEHSVRWVATLTALESASAVSLGYIDYQSSRSNDKDLIYAMRKKRLAFAKFSFIMASLSLFLMDAPSGNCIFPLFVGLGWTILKMATQMGFHLAPEKFYTARTMVALYSLVFIGLVWYKQLGARKEKLELEFLFFQRVEGIMLQMSNIMHD
mmetsp:Transcript_40675/g.29947  ORF Transcript_40675/g.29947 Transcript_40675/m.29947 type:complete len:169 (+) Transcript_40675:280-786(+)